jgi:hypothetical protein
MYDVTALQGLRAATLNGKVRSRAMSGGTTKGRKMKAMGGLGGTRHKMTPRGRGRGK